MAPHGYNLWLLLASRPLPFIFNACLAERQQLPIVLPFIGNRNLEANTLVSFLCTTKVLYVYSIYSISKSHNINLRLPMINVFQYKIFYKATYFRKHKKRTQGPPPIPRKTIPLPETDYRSTFKGTLQRPRSSKRPVSEGLRTNIPREPMFFDTNQRSDFRSHGYIERTKPIIPVCCTM